MPTMFAGKAAELVTVALPLVAVTVIERDAPSPDGLNGRLLSEYAEIVTVVLNAGKAQAAAIRSARNVFLIGLD